MLHLRKYSRGQFQTVLQRQLGNILLGVSFTITKAPCMIPSSKLCRDMHTKRRHQFPPTPFIDGKTFCRLQKRCQNIITNWQTSIHADIPSFYSYELWICSAHSAHDCTVANWWQGRKKLPIYFCPNNINLTECFEQSIACKTPFGWGPTGQGQAIYPE
jgi:hypothetical protein